LLFNSNYKAFYNAYEKPNEYNIHSTRQQFVVFSFGFVFFFCALQKRKGMKESQYFKARYYVLKSSI